MKAKLNEFVCVILKSYSQWQGVILWDTAVIFFFSISSYKLQLKHTKILDMQTKNHDNTVKLQYYRNRFLTLHVGKIFSLLSPSLPRAVFYQNL